MSDDVRSSLEARLRLGATGDPEARRDVVERLRGELSTSLQRLQRQSEGAGPEDAGLDMIEVTRHLSVRLLSEESSQELRPELMRGLAVALGQALADAGDARTDLGPRVLLAPTPAGAPRRTVPTRGLADALDRMEQLKGDGSLLTILCLVLGLSVDECAGALQRSSDVVQLEWLMARDWMARELGLQRDAGNA